MTTVSSDSSVEFPKKKTRSYVEEGTRYLFNRFSNRTIVLEIRQHKKKKKSSHKDKDKKLHQISP